MADVAAKREARRRRILENSEYRLKRITGQANCVEPSEELCKKVVGAEIQPTTSSCAANGILASEALIGHESVNSLINELNADIAIDEADSPYTAEHDIFTLLSTPNVPHRRVTGQTSISGENGNRAGLGTVKLNSSNNVGFNADREDVLLGSQLDNTDRDDSISNTNTEPSIFNTLLSSRLIYVLLAILVNIMVILNMEHLFGTSIVVPFFVVMLGRLCVGMNHDESRSSNMLVGALILCNVRPDLVKVIIRLKGSLSLFGKVFQDFAVYIFTFVIIYTIIYRYSNELGDNSSFSNGPKVIINDNPSM